MSTLKALAPLRPSLPLTLALSLVLGGCGGGGSASADTPTTPTTPTPVTVVSSLGDFPDPFLLAEGGTTYAFATNANGRNVQVASSTDLSHFTAQADAMPQLAAWASPSFGLTWAPEVIKVGSSYLMYYTGRDKASNKQCVGVAKASAPAGPYTDNATAPLVCQVAEGGSIDPSPWRDSTGFYLYVKSDGNCCSLPTSIYAVPLAADGLSTAGAPVKLLTNDATSWEHAVIEAPTMFQHDGQYLLFYSGGDYADSSYAVGYATCAGPTGPCVKSGANPVLKSRNDTSPKLIGPGHQSLLQVGSQTWIAYHAWEVTSAGTRGNRRFMYVDKLDWVAGQPAIQGPTMVP
jgi:beta-xylosidase